MCCERTQRYPDQNCAGGGGEGEGGREGGDGEGRDGEGGEGEGGEGEGGVKVREVGRDLSVTARQTWLHQAIAIISVCFQRMTQQSDVVHV